MRLVWLNPIAGCETFYLCLFQKAMYMVYIARKRNFNVQSSQSRTFGYGEGEKQKWKGQKREFHTVSFKSLQGLLKGQSFLFNENKLKF